MSKLVLVIFLFSLLLLMTQFMLIYQDKVIADTAKGFTTLWSESANSAVSFSSAGASQYLERQVSVRDENQLYTIVVQNVDDTRVVFFLAWKDFEGELFSEIETELRDEGGFAAASSLNMPLDVDTVCIYRGEDFTGSLEYMNDNILVARPSNPDLEYSDDYLLFYKNENKFCVASKKNEADLTEAMNVLAEECEANTPC